MRFFSLSIRSHVLIFIVLMGVVALILEIATAAVFRYFSGESQKQAFERLAQLEVAELLVDLGKNSADLAVRLQHAKAFQDVFRVRDVKGLSHQLNDQFRQYYHTAGIIRIRRIQVFDLNLNFVSE